jgi:thiaminase/transcriptional activator TenA
VAVIRPASGAFAAALPEVCPDDWRMATRHAFVLEVAHGTLSPERFDVWIRQDHHFVRGLGRVVRTLADRAPATDRDGLLDALPALEAEMEMFRRHAEERGIGLASEISLICSDYLSYLLGRAAASYPEGLTAYYACERVYYEAWTQVAAVARPGGPYADWIANWSSDAFGGFVGWLGERLDDAVLGLDDKAVGGLHNAFTKVVRFEIAFWDICLR